MIHKINKKMIKPDMANIYLRQPKEFLPLLDLENSLDDIKHQNGLKDMFTNFITPLSNNTTSKEAINKAK